MWNENDGPSVTISLKEYEQISLDSAKLAALEAGGVDNWEGYSYAMREFHKGVEE